MSIESQKEYGSRFDSCFIAEPGLSLPFKTQQSMYRIPKSIDVLDRGSSGALVAKLPLGK